jgi:hypothetical protein
MKIEINLSTDTYLIADSVLQFYVSVLINP